MTIGLMTHYKGCDIYATFKNMEITIDRIEVLPHGEFIEQVDHEEVKKLLICEVNNFICECAEVSFEKIIVRYLHHQHHSIFDNY